VDLVVASTWKSPAPGSRQNLEIASAAFLYSTLLEYYRIRSTYILTEPHNLVEDFSEGQSLVYNFPPTALSAPAKSVKNLHLPFFNHSFCFQSFAFCG